MPIFSLRSHLFDSFDDAPAAWRELCPRDDLAMDLDVLRVFQHTLKDQCRCWGLVIYDQHDVAVGCAALCRFPTELIETSNKAVIRGRDALRRLWPGFARMNVLFCGLPIPSGSMHVRLRDGVTAGPVIAEIDRVMQQLARATGSRMLVFKELDNHVPWTGMLNDIGYIRGDIPPMHVFDRHFNDFAHYRASLKSRYRAQVQRSQKKLAAAGFEILCGRGAAFFSQHFDAHCHTLYVAVQQKAEQKLELLPPDFFHAMAEALGDEALLTVIRRDGRVCAFTFAVTRGQTHYNMYSGLDYALNNEGDLYFNLFYHDMDQAWRAGATSLHLGQTSDAFKSRLGSSTQNLSFYVRARPAAFHALLRRFAALAFPKVAPVEPHHVFAEAD